ncbi:MAG: tetratricopeptide repeat protein [Deltaproteobacteria bacterium]|nr:MAG: tetratricopeptide repeat protein [Deltaproteobacteria bacterium]
MMKPKPTLSLLALLVHLLLSGCGGPPKPAETPLPGEVNPPTTPQEDLARGMRAMQQGNYESAIEAYQRAIQKDERNVEAWLHLGEAYELSGNPEEAVAQYKKVLELDPTHLEAYHALGRLYERFENYGAAAMVYGRALEQYPEKRELYYKTATAMLEAGSLHGAESVSREALERDPDDARALLLLGKALLAQGKLDGARNAFEAVVARDPLQTEAYTLLGVVFMRMGKIEDAQVNLAKALDLNPDLAAAHYNLALAIRGQRHRLPEALQHLEKAVALEPDDPDIREELARTYFEMGMYDEAANEMKRVIHDDPENPERYLFLAKIYEQMNEVGASIQALSKATQLLGRD